MMNELLENSTKSTFLEEITQKENIEWMQKQSYPYRLLLKCYKCAMMEVETKFKVLNEEYSLMHDDRNPIETMKTRLKSLDSIVDKLRKYEKPFCLESIEQYVNDVAGVRIICAFPKDVYTLAEDFLKQDDIVLIAKKDYIANPKPNGYRSLHLIVEVPIFLAQEKKMMKVEIQLRTIAMDFWASLEHQLKYKKQLPNIDSLMHELYECAEVSANLDRRMDKIRRDIEKAKYMESLPIHEVK